MQQKALNFVPPPSPLLFYHKVRLSMFVFLSREILSSPPGVGKPGFSYWSWKDSETTLFVQDNEAGYLGPQERAHSCEKGRGPQLFSTCRYALLMAKFLNSHTNQAAGLLGSCLSQLSLGLLLRL